MPRFTESQLRTPTTGQPAGPSLPGFVACPVSHVPLAVQQTWQAMYQFAFAQAIARLLEDSRPTRYQRLLWRVSLN